MTSCDGVAPMRSRGPADGGPSHRVTLRSPVGALSPTIRPRDPEGAGVAEAAVTTCHDWGMSSQLVSAFVKSVIGTGFVGPGRLSDDHGDKEAARRRQARRRSEERNRWVRARLWNLVATPFTGLAGVLIAPLEEVSASFSSAIQSATHSFHLELAPGIYLYAPVHS